MSLPGKDSVCFGIFVFCLGEKMTCALVVFCRAVKTSDEAPTEEAPTKLRCCPKKTTDNKQNVKSTKNSNKQPTNNKNISDEAPTKLWRRHKKKQTDNKKHVKPTQNRQHQQTKTIDKKNSDEDPPKLRRCQKKTANGQPKTPKQQRNNHNTKTNKQTNQKKLGRSSDHRRVASLSNGGLWYRSGPSASLIADQLTRTRCQNRANRIRAHCPNNLQQLASWCNG